MKIPVASLAQINFIRSEKKNIIKANQVGLLSCFSPEDEGKEITEWSDVSWLGKTHRGLPGSHSGDGHSVNYSETFLIIFRLRRHACCLESRPHHSAPTSRSENIYRHLLFALILLREEMKV